MSNQPSISIISPRAGSHPPSARLAIRCLHLVTAALLLGEAGSVSLLAGSVESSSPTAENTVLEKADSDPLSFDDGKATIDVQERLRVEVRDKRYDFNSKVDAITDDTFLLQRFRIGLLVKPTAWLDLYAQTQDSREIGSKRPYIPGLNGAEGTDAFDVRQAYFKLGDPKTFRSVSPRGGKS